MAQRLTIRLALALLALSACTFPLAIACGPAFPTATFISGHPDLPLDGYAAGNLGVVLADYSPSYLAVAYRYFENRPFDRDEQSQLVSAWNARLYAYVDGSNSSSQGANAGPVFDVYARSNGQGWLESPNCLEDAFETAEKTREDRIRQFGAASGAVASWLAAQAAVFKNCDGTTAEMLPSAADPSLPLIIRKDRDYQIAAAYLYSGHFDEAKSRFLAIADDADSPWRATAGLVAARCDIRMATLGNDDPTKTKEKLAAADQQLKALIANPAFSSMKASAQRLRGFVGYRLDPDAQTNELADAIARNTAPGAVGANLLDYDRLIREGHPRFRSEAAAETNDLTDWIGSFRYGGPPDRQDHRVTRWEQTHSAAWLAAALAYAQPGDAKTPEVLDAAAKIPATAPAYLTIAFHQNRLLAHSDKQEQARSNIDRILKLPKGQLSPSTRNLFLALRMQAAKNLDEFLEFAPRQPLGVLLSIDVDDPELCDRAPNECVHASGPLLDSDAAVELTEAMPTSVLVQAAASTRLRGDLRIQVAETAWVRAILLDQDEQARRLVPVLSSLEPDLAPMLKAYADQPAAAERKFAAVFLILRRPALTPYVHAGIGRYGWDKPSPPGAIDSYRQNWWCTFAPAPPPGTPFGPASINTGMLQQRMKVSFRPGLAALYPQDNPVSPGFLTAEERGAAANEWASLLREPAAPDWLGQQVLDWAQAHPNDPRVPEALHRTVVSTRYGCNDSATGAYSKQAFTLLHSRYSKSTWATQTPYWFN